ncbi:phosphotransferase [Amnibacterium flavum]|uniref:Macrolide 2'-phosphotransferase n=1 Tax=Amnibacterium flavum TaxID=2173173 RepID=A0A2V1HMZ8_9MICO|nr:phosphotransferase [Amnibacterium flavum]PVZ93791.1 macrolide 2'-phosphotransferase [Amnibacterium flavum]
MARSHLTLAALATSAVPGLDVAAAQPFTSHRQGEFDSALLTARDGKHYLVRVANSESAAKAQTAELSALGALSSGVRTRLPFALSTFVGQTVIKPKPGERGGRAVVSEFVYGRRLTLDLLTPDSPLPESVGRALAAMHSLPTSVVVDAGLPVVSAIDNLRSVVGIMDRAAATSMVPASLLSRWESATDDTSLWQFQTTVVHGAMSADVLLYDADGQIAGIIGWSDLRVGDPARDLSWALSAPSPDSVEQIFGSYSAGRHGAADREIRRRAMLYAELELARWLLFGLEARDQSIVDDAVQMLDVLVESVRGDQQGSLAHETGPILDVDEVRQMLSERPHVAQGGGRGALTE